MDLKKIQKAYINYKEVFSLDKESLLYFLDNLTFNRYEDFYKSLGKQGINVILSRVPPDHLLHYCFKSVQKTNL